MLLCRYSRYSLLIGTLKCQQEALDLLCADRIQILDQPNPNLNPTVNLYEYELYLLVLDPLCINTVLGMD